MRARLSGAIIFDPWNARTIIKSRPLWAKAPIVFGGIRTGKFGGFSSHRLWRPSAESGEIPGPESPGKNRRRPGQKPKRRHRDGGEGDGVSYGGENGGAD